MNARRRVRITRDGVLFVTGLAGIVYETIVTGGDRPTLLVLFGAMVGLPAFLRTDEKNVEPPAPSPPPSPTTTPTPAQPPSPSAPGGTTP